MYYCRACKDLRLVTRCPRCGATGIPLPPFRGWQSKGRPPAGSQGQVFYCADGAHERAVKIIDLGLKDAADALTARENFEREHKALRGLRHDHVVALIDGGDLGELLYLVTECLPGTLRGALDQHPHQPLPLPRAIHIAVQLADALAYIHDQDVVHRDIKPANIGLTHGDHVRLFDFGLAGFRRTGALSSMAGAFGTPGYAAPEQLPPPGVGLEEVRPRTGTWTDCFSFGVVLHELLSGSPPRYLGISSTWPPPLPSDPARPAAVDTLVAACLEPDIDRRLRDAWRLQDELGDVADRLTVKHQQSQAAWQQIGRELPGLRKERERLKNEVRALEARHTALEAALASEAAKQRQQATVTLSAEVARLEAQRASLAAETTRLDQQHVALQAEAARLGRATAEARHTAGIAEADLSAIRAEIAAAEAALSRPGFRWWPVVGLLVGTAVGYLIGHAGQSTPEPADAAVSRDAGLRLDARLMPPPPDAARPRRDATMPRPLDAAPPTEPPPRDAVPPTPVDAAPPTEPPPIPLAVWGIAAPVPAHKVDGGLRLDGRLETPKLVPRGQDQWIAEIGTILKTCDNRPLAAADDLTTCMEAARQRTEGSKVPRMTIQLIHPDGRAESVAVGVYE